MFCTDAEQAFHGETYRRVTGILKSCIFGTRDRAKAGYGSAYLKRWTL